MRSTMNVLLFNPPKNYINDILLTQGCFIIAK